jgi:hypothetical protein
MSRACLGNVTVFSVNWYKHGAKKAFVLRTIRLQVPDITLVTHITQIAQRPRTWRWRCTMADLLIQRSPASDLIDP